jgi:glycosyltransferase involved in cell wall biosynthesis
MPKISVVVPCYNGGKFLDQLTACLARQTLRDFEIVIVDDGSTDSATKLKLASLGPAIRVVHHQENRGLSAARNTGFSESRGGLVMPLDCDDLLEPTYLEETYGVLHSAPPEVGFVFTHDLPVEGRPWIKKNYFNEFDALSKNVTGYSMLVRKSAWQKVGGYDESMRDGYEDWEFHLRLISAGYRGIEIPKPLFIYNIGTQGMLMSHSSRMHAELWRSIRNKHSELYRVSNIIRLFFKTRSARTEISPFRTVLALLLTRILPDSWYSAIIHSIRSYRLSRSNKRSASTAHLAALRPDVGRIG